ncbi:MAG: PAS domain S-box protein [Chloroflexi bacterium]|nr:PAS domain S-box protein [Chloroflexota bacterium]
MRSLEGIVVSAAARLTTIYVIIGSLWILFSDSVLAVFTGSDTHLYASAQTIKGWVFIAITAAVLYFLLKREFDARQKSEQATLEREVNFRDLFANNPLPMWVCDLATLQFLDVNEATCNHYGYSRDEFLRMHLADIRPPEELERLKAFIAQQPETGYAYAGEWLHRTKSGKIITVEISAHTLKYNGIRAVLAVARDVTESKRMAEDRLENERLRVQLSKETELNHMRNRFISMVSHEFRRPLTTITTSVELLENYRSKMSEEGAQKHFNRIHEQLAETNDLLDDFLALMRSEVAQQNFKPTSIDLTEICRKLIDQLKASSQTKHIIQYASSCEQVMLQGDEKLLRQAISNLLTNAIKYSPSGGEVRLDLLHTHDIEIHVSDQGIGIPLKDQENLFEPFFRASNVGDAKGTGLGLSIARQAIELHSGTLKIGRSDYSGTEFVITLPVNEGTFLTGC